MNLTQDNVAAHIRNDGATEWATLASILGSGALSCVDGREPDAILGTPGGDAGEYLVHIAAIEALTGAQLPDARVPEVFARFMRHFGRFYMHTDSHAMENLRQALVADAAFPVSPADLAATEALVRSPGAHADALLPHVLTPDNVGCGHLKLILKHPEQYGVRPGLANAFITAVFRALWAGADIDYVVLQGGHAEGAVVQVSTGGATHAHTQVPKVAPLSEGEQMFVQHPDVVAWLRNQMAIFLGGAEPLLEGVDIAAFAKAVDQLANQQLGATLGHLAKGLPLYQAQVTESGTVAVSGDAII